MPAPPINQRLKPHWLWAAPFKEAVRVATTANITIATGLNVGDVIDGVTLADLDRVLVKSQTAPAENGIWIAGATPVRAYDESTDDPSFGYLVFVIEGSVNAQTLWRNTNTAPPTIGSTSIGFAGAAGAGTVTSVALTVPAEFSVSGSPVTSSGTLAISKANEAANTVWAGPTSGSAAAPTFRALVTADLPSGIGSHILLADGRSTPFSFNDMLQADDGSDFLWSD